MIGPLRLGLIGASRIVPAAIVEPAIANDDVQIVGIAARDRTRAEEFASQHNMAMLFDSYAHLIESHDVDVVYISTPPFNHESLTLAALAAGKHVICEKPIAMNAVQAARMVEAAKTSHRVLIEAYHWRYHPMASRITAILSSGAIGEVIDIDAVFSIPLVPAGDFRWNTSLGGGVLMDVGCYPVQWARHVAQCEASVLSAQMVCGPVDRSDASADASMTATLLFSNGITARLHSDMGEGSNLAATLTVAGSRGSMVVQNPLAPQFGNSITVESEGVTTRETVERGTTYEWQLRAIVEAIQHGTPSPTGGTDSMHTMVAIDSIYTKSGFLPRPDV